MRNHRTPQQWQALIQAFDRSDLTVKDFCRQNKLSTSSFYLWKNRFGQQSSAKPSARDEFVVADNQSPSWLKLSQTESSSLNSSADAPWDIELSLPAGLTLRMRAPSC